MCAPSAGLAKSSFATTAEIQLKAGVLLLTLEEKQKQF